MLDKYNEQKISQEINFHLFVPLRIRKHNIKCVTNNARSTEEAVNFREHSMHDLC